MHAYRMSKRLISKIKKVIAVSVLIIFSSCAKYLNIPAIPAEKTTISAELEYIAKTDQADRKKGFIHIIFNDKKGKEIILRDCIRAERVYSLFKSDSLTDDHDYFIAGLIFMHSPIKGHGKLAYDMFEYLEKHGKTKTGNINGKNWKQIVIDQKIYIPIEDHN